MLRIAEAAIRLERRWIVRADVEHDLIAGAQQLGGDGPRHGGRVAATTIVDMRQDVADDGDPCLSADDVRTRCGHEAATDADPEIDPVTDRRRRQPRGESQLVQAVELTDVDGEQPPDVGRIRPEPRPVDPHPDHLRPRVQAVRGLDGLDRVGQDRDVRGAGPDDVAEDRLDPVGAAHDEQRLRGQPGVLESDGDEAIPVERPAPARLAELAVLEVADRVGGEEPIGLEEVPQLATIGHGARREAPRAPARRCDAGHQPAARTGSEAGASAKTPAAVPRAAERRATDAATAAASPSANGGATTPSSVTTP